MSSETQPKPDAGAQREADVYDVLAWLEVNKKRVAIVALVLVALGFAIATLRYMKEQKELKASGALLALKPTLTQPTTPSNAVTIPQTTNSAVVAIRLTAYSLFVPSRSSCSRHSLIGKL